MPNGAHCATSGDLCDTRLAARRQSLTRPSSHPTGTPPPQTGQTPASSPSLRRGRTWTQRVCAPRSPRTRRNWSPRSSRRARPLTSSRRVWSRNTVTELACCATVSRLQLPPRLRPSPADRKRGDERIPVGDGDVAVRRQRRHPRPLRVQLARVRRARQRGYRRGARRVADDQGACDTRARGAAYESHACGAPGWRFACRRRQICASSSVGRFSARAWRRLTRIVAGCAP